MKIVYEEGPETITMGIAGQFRCGEPKDVSDEIAELLLKKETIKFKNVDEIPKQVRDDKKKKGE